MNWLRKIKIKYLLHNDNLTEKEITLKISEILSKDLNNIKIKLTNDKRFDENTKYTLNIYLESVISFNEFVNALSSGEIKENEYDEYDFNGNFKKLCNDLLTMLYNLGDVKINSINGKLYSFIWIE